MSELGKDSKQVVVAMSGGVDSSVAALLLHEQGHDVVGVSMQVWDYRKNGGCESKATCCSPDDFTDARKVAASIGVPYYVFDFEETFKEKVIDNFVNKYSLGLTPNPCIDCNSNVKFHELRERTLSLGYSYVATGHFARLEKSKEGFHLLRGRDSAKDQSYFLYGLTQKEMSETIFPVGEYTKDEVRELAKKAGLVTASKPESQDICFVSGKVQDFIAKHGGKTPAGKIVTKDGKVIGEHDGIYRYTVGQRRGLNVSYGPNPLYVIELDVLENRLIVGDKSDLEQESFQVSELSWVSPSLVNAKKEKGFSFMSMVQVRYRHEGVLAKVAVVDENTVEVTFDDEWTAVSPGQAAVFYDIENKEVLAGGRILPPLRNFKDSSKSEMLNVIS